MRGSDYRRPDGVLGERSGWRDRRPSEWHRAWGFDCPYTDIDGLEYDEGIPVCLIDFKYWQGFLPPLDDANRSALTALADNYAPPSGDRGLPFFYVFYWDNKAFRVYPANDKAREWLLPKANDFSEQEYVRFLYKLRGREIPRDIWNRLNHEKPPPAPAGWP